MKLRLTTRISLYFVLVSAVLLTVVGTLSYRSGSESLKAAAVKEILASAIEKEAEVDTWFDERTIDIEEIASKPELARAAARLIKAAPASAEAGATHAMLVEELTPYAADPRSNMIELFVIDPEGGKVVASTRPAEEGKLEAGHPYFDKGKSGFDLEGPYNSVDAHAPIITAATPMRGADGRLVAVLAVRLDLAPLNTIVSRRTGLGQTNDAFLVNAERFPVTQPRYIQEPVVLRRKLDSVAVRRCAAGDSGVMLAPDYRGVPSIAVCRWDAKRQLGLLVKVDQAEALAPVRALARTVAAVGGLALLAATGIALLLARSITRPLRALQDRVQRFADGSAATPLPESGDELGMVAREFNRMAVLVSEDISARKASEEALRASEERFRTLTVATSDVVWHCTAGGECIGDVPSWREFTGQSGDEMLGFGWMSAIYPDDMSRMQEQWARAAEARDVFAPELRIRRHDGQYRDFVVKGVPVQGADGDIREWVGSCSDVTARKQAETAISKANRELKVLSEQNQIAAAVIENSTEGVMVTDARLQIESVNPAFERITGYPAAEAVGQSPNILFSGRHDDAFFHRMQDQVDAQGHWHGEIWNRRRGGELYPQKTSVNVLRDADGRVSHYASVFSDNTLQNRLEAKLRELSSVDALTRVANRRSFDETLAREWARAQRERSPLSLVIMDIDHFKAYNDRHGHPGGDACLQQVAQAMTATVNRASDLVARYGGEEFAVILPATDAAAAAVMAEKVRSAVAALALPHGDSGTAAFVTISVGAATMARVRGSQQAELISAADRALYQAKHSGRNRVVSAPRSGPAVAGATLERRPAAAVR